MIDNANDRSQDDRDVLRGVVAQIAIDLAAHGWGQPARLSVLHGPTGHLVESELAVSHDAQDVATVLAGLFELTGDPNGRAAIDLVVNGLAPQPVQAWLLVFETATSTADPVPERFTLAVDGAGRSCAALSSGHGSVPAVALVEFTPDELTGSSTLAYHYLATLAGQSTGSAR